MFEAQNEELHRLRYTINICEYMAKLKEKLLFANCALLNKEFNDLLLKKLGPHTEEDVKMKEKANESLKNKNKKILKKPLKKSIKNQ